MDYQICQNCGKPKRLIKSEPNYLSEMLKVYKSASEVCPIICTVTKNPTRNGKLRRLDLDTAFLLEKSGGTFDYNGSNWGRVRREVIRRDKVCQICFTDKYLDVHHIIPRRVFGKKNYEKFNQINNLILLCKKHHRKTELILFEVEKNGLPNMPELWKAETIDKVRTKLFVGNVEGV